MTTTIEKSYRPSDKFEQLIPYRLKDLEIQRPRSQPLAINPSYKHLDPSADSFARTQAKKQMSDSTINRTLHATLAQQSPNDEKEQTDSSSSDSSMHDGHMVNNLVESSSSESAKGSEYDDEIPSSHKQEEISAQQSESHTSDKEQRKDSPNQASKQLLPTNQPYYKADSTVNKSSIYNEKQVENRLNKDRDCKYAQMLPQHKHMGIPSSPIETIRWQHSQVQQVQQANPFLNIRLPGPSSLPALDSSSGFAMLPDYLSTSMPVPILHNQHPSQFNYPSKNYSNLYEGKSPPFLSYSYPYPPYCVPIPSYDFNTYHQRMPFTDVPPTASVSMPHMPGPTHNGLPKSTTNNSKGNLNAKIHNRQPHSRSRSHKQPNYKHDTNALVSAEQMKVYQSTEPLIPTAVPSSGYLCHSIELKIDLALENPKSTKNIYIRGLQPDTTDFKLEQLAKKFGPTTQTKAILDSKTSACKGFGFAEYENIHDAKISIVVLVNCGYQASFAKESFNDRLKDLQDLSTTNLYICNLPMDYTESDLQGLLKPFECQSVKMCSDKNKRGRGVGFAQLKEDRATAEKAIEKFNNLQFFPDLPPLQVRFADSPGQKDLKSQASARRDLRAEEYHMNIQNLTDYMPASPPK